MILLRKALRDVLAMGTRAVLLVLVIGAGIGMAGGIKLALQDVQATRDAFYQRQGLADLDVRLARAVPSNVLLTRARQAGATLAETRIVYDGTASTASTGTRRTAAEVLGVAAGARLDRLAITDGHGLSNADPLGAAVEAEYARKAGLRVGDELRLTLGGRQFMVRMRGLARSPEYLLATADPQYLIPQPGSLAVVFLPKAGLASILGTGGQANDLVADFPGGASPARDQAVAAGLPVSRLTPRSEQYSLRFTNADLRSFQLFVPVLGAIFAAVGFLLIGLSLRRIVHAQRRELGTLLAIGYRRPAVLATALLPAAMLAIPGAAIAVAVTIGIARLVAGTYVSAVGFPAVVNTLDPATLGEAAAVALGATILAAALPAWTLLRLNPASAMRGDPAIRFTVPAWLRRPTGAASPSVTYASRSLARRPLLTVATTLSLAAAIGLAVAMNLLIGSTSQAVDETFAGQRWTATADLAQAMPASSAVALARGAGAGAAEPVVQGPARLEIRGNGVDVELVGLPTAPQLERLDITTGHLPHPGQVLLSEQTAQSLHAVPGEILRVVTPNGQREMTVSGTTRTLAAGQSFSPYEDAAPALGLTGQADSMFLAASNATVQRLLARPEVSRVTTLAAARSGMHELVKELTGLIDVLLAISLGVGGLFLISSLALSFLDRQGEFATLRALGYGRNRIATILGTESLGESAVAGALSIPAGLLIAWPLAARIGQAWFRIGLHPAPSDFALVIALAIALALLVASQATRRVLRLDIARVVRARLIG